MSNWLDLLVEKVLISEGYKEVQNRITPLLQTQIPNFDPDRIKMAFSKHKNNKNKLPEEFQNIDAYFAKKYDANLKKRYEALIAELDKIPDKSVTKQQSKNNLFEELKIIENDEYILFEVKSHEDAVKLVRPGKNNPYGWPAMLPVTWCITADSEEGEEMWAEYCYDYQHVSVKSCTSTNIVYLYGSNFYFAFRKHPKYDMEMDDKKVNPMDFIAIQAYADGHFEYTPAPNDDLGNPNGVFGHGKDWPSTVPESWKQYCVCYNRVDDLICDDMDVSMFISALVSNPQFADLAKKYNIFEKINGNDWFQILHRQPQFINLAKEYNAFEKFDSDNWCWLLRDQPQLVDLAKKYNAFEKFNSDDWHILLWRQPQFKDLAKQYGYKP